MPLATAPHPELPSGEYCHWNERPGVPPAEAMLMLAVVPPTHMSAGEVGFVVTLGSATTDTVAVLTPVAAQPLLLAVNVKAPDAVVELDQVGLCDVLPGLYVPPDGPPVHDHWLTYVPPPVRLTVPPWQIAVGDALAVTEVGAVWRYVNTDEVPVPNQIQLVRLVLARTMVVEPENHAVEVPPALKVTVLPLPFCGFIRIASTVAGKDAGAVQLYQVLAVTVNW